jgi:hypothetical protein
MPPGVKLFSEAEKRAAIELWKAGISLKNSRDQLKMSERGLRNILAFAKAHPEVPIPKKSKNAGRPSKISLGAIMEMKKRLARNPCIRPGSSRRTSHSWKMSVSPSSRCSARIS